jgi:hypothetical protein
MAISKKIYIPILWISAALISIVSFYFHGGYWPSVGDAIIGHTLYTLLAMPFSFVHTVTFYDGAALRIFGLPFIALLFGYWGTLIYLHVKYLKNREVKYLTLLAVIILLSSVKWLYYSMALVEI